jgi:ABC-type uncharacterized transport system ATPase subunit
VQIRNSHEAIALGIGMVHQHFMLVDKLTALDNVHARRRTRLVPALRPTQVRQGLMR